MKLPDYWDEDFTFNDCYATYKQSAEYMGVWDIDEYLAPSPTNPWTKNFVESYLDSNWTSWGDEYRYLALPMAWIDKGRFGEIQEELLVSQDATLRPVDVEDIQRLEQTAGGIRFRFFQDYNKAIHRTSRVRGAGIHGGWPGLGAKQYPDNMGLAIYHARREHGTPRQEFVDFPTTPSMVGHWRNLVRNIRALHLNVVYQS